jgi:oligogalacturonide transport system substrate-binding protein
MKQLLKLIVVILFASILAGSAVGCKTTSGKSKDTTNQKVTLTFMWWGGDARHKATLAAIALYEKAHPNVTIDAQYSGYDGYLAKLTTELAGGTAPDIMQFDYLWRQALAYNTNNFIDFKKYPKDIDLTQFNMKAVDPYGAVNNSLFGLPTGVAPFVLEVNKASCEKYGIDTSTDWTWDDLIQQGKKANEADPQAYFLTNEGDSSSQNFQMIVMPYVIQQTGQQFIKDNYTLGFTKAQLTSAFVYLKELYDNKVEEPAAESATYTALTENPKWLNGKVVASFGYASTINTDFQSDPNNEGVIMLPIAKDAKDSGVQCPVAQLLTVSKQSKHIVNAVDFVNAFLNDPDMVKVLGTVRSIPESKVAVETLQKANLIDAVVKKGCDIALAKPGLVHNTVSDNAELGTIGVDVSDEVQFGRTTPEKAADEFITRANNELATLKAAG